jgi:hypothetical protein
MIIYTYLRFPIISLLIEQLGDTGTKYLASVGGGPFRRRADGGRCGTRGAMGDRGPNVDKLVVIMRALTSQTPMRLKTYPSCNLGWLKSQKIPEPNSFRLQTKSSSNVSSFRPTRKLSSQNIVRIITSDDRPWHDAIHSVVWGLHPKLLWCSAMVPLKTLSPSS